MRVQDVSGDLRCKTKDFLDGESLHGSLDGVIQWFRSHIPPCPVSVVKEFWFSVSIGRQTAVAFEDRVSEDSIGPVQLGWWAMGAEALTSRDGRRYPSSRLDKFVKRNVPNTAIEGIKKKETTSV